MESKYHKRILSSVKYKLPIVFFMVTKGILYRTCARRSCPAACFDSAPVMADHPHSLVPGLCTSSHIKERT